MTRTRRFQAIVASGAVIVGGSAVAVSQLTGSSRSRSIGEPAVTLAQGVKPLVGSLGNCRDVPAKMWGGTWHYSPAILKPTKLEHVCITYPRTGPLRTKGKVTMIPVPK